MEDNQGEPSGNMQMTTILVFDVVIIPNGIHPVIPLVLVPFSSLWLVGVGWR